MVRKSAPSSAVVQVFLIVFGLMFAGFACVWVLIAWRSNAPIFALLFGIPFIVVGLGIVVWGALQFVARARIGAPAILVSPDTLRVGERFTFTLEHTFKSSVDVQRILVQLLQRETARYRRGTDTYTVTYEDVVKEFELPARPYRRGEMLYDNRSLQIPRTGMHTFQARYNRIQWFVRVKIKVSGWPDLNQEQELVVLPELAKEEA